MYHDNYNTAINNNGVPVCYLHTNLGPYHACALFVVY